MIAAQCDLVADELVAELERVEAVTADGAVPQAYHRVAQDRLDLVLQLVEIFDSPAVLSLMVIGAPAIV
jgi:hypothetical protein